MNRSNQRETAGMQIDERCVRNLFGRAGFTGGLSIHSYALVTLGHSWSQYRYILNNSWLAVRGGATGEPLQR